MSKWKDNTQAIVVYETWEDIVEIGKGREEEKEEAKEDWIG